jgi:natural product biosynthesis luciferase-like monooxygenase protein
VSKNGENIEDIYPLSPMQEGVLFHTVYAPETAVYFDQWNCILEGYMDVPAWQKAWQRVIDRHQVLRSAFIWGRKEESFQVVNRKVRLSWDQQDWRGLSEATIEGRLSSYLEADRGRGFELSRAPLMRYALIRIADDVWRFIWSYHQLLLDGWSRALVVREVIAFYDAFTGGAAAQFEQPRPYRDYIAWLRMQDLAPAEVFWRRVLKGFNAATSLGAELGVQVLQERSQEESHERSMIAVEDYRSVSVRLTEGVTSALKSLARDQRLTLNTIVLGAWAILLSRHSGEEDVVFGTVVSGRPPALAGAETMVGLFINSIPVRTRVLARVSFLAWLQTLQSALVESREYEYSPLVQVRGWSEVPRGQPLFESILVFENFFQDSSAATQTGPLRLLGVDYIERTNYALTIIAEPGPELELRFLYESSRFDQDSIRRMAGHLATLLEEIGSNPRRLICALTMLTAGERQHLLTDWNNTRVDLVEQGRCIHEIFESQAERIPDSSCVVFETQYLTYRELNSRANQLAGHLRMQGVGPEVRVGICVERGLEMLVGLIGILKAGGAYVPLDPQYPVDRIEYMLQDSGAKVLVTQDRLLHALPGHSIDVVCIDTAAVEVSLESEANGYSGVVDSNPAYVIYTSGSTGLPKGVVVGHDNVINFFKGMDDSIGPNLTGAPFLAVTSISFDISVLELFWTLSRGFQVVIQGPEDGGSSLAQPPDTPADKQIDFSLFYFASESNTGEGKIYDLLIQGAKFADQHGFTAVWSPERHFHAFGGLYPNPSVIGAALATITENIEIRAGSVVMPLHDPIRVAEEWSIVDNLSNGRVAISFASGWHADDFVLASTPFADRHEVMFKEIETVRRLWRGESVVRVGGMGNEVEVRIRPIPIRPELPVWITAAGNPKTFQKAGELGFNLLTHLLGHSIDELREKIDLYRASWKQHGHGPGAGRVALMIHTFVERNLDIVRDTVREPFTNYLRSAVGLIRRLARSLGKDMDSKEFTEQDLEDILAHAFDRYFKMSGLMGTPRSCMAMVERLKAAGVDEVACLIDFGIDHTTVRASLRYLNMLKELSNSGVGERRGARPIREQIADHGITHMQSTPSMARILAMELESLSLKSIQKLMVGGEALTASLAKQLRQRVSGEIHNMYGPTETTIWSMTYPIEHVANIVPIGRPIANTQIRLLDRFLELVPVGIPGKLFIGGAGVVRGYLNRPELTAEKFIPDSFTSTEGSRLYDTGDRASYLPDGNVEYLGRIDNQVKIRGHRIELGEIEAVLRGCESVKEVVVHPREDAAGDIGLIAYVVAEEGFSPTIEGLRRHGNEILPDYMLPSVLVRLDSLPLTPNGKIDRRALPAPGQIADTGRQYVAPSTDTELRLAAVWSEVLKIDQIGVNDDFFEFGGHSLIAMQVVARIRLIFRIDMPLRDLFHAHTIARLAEHIDTRLWAEQARDNYQPVVEASREEVEI